MHSTIHQTKQYANENPLDPIIEHKPESLTPNDVNPLWDIMSFTDLSTENKLTYRCQTPQPYIDDFRSQNAFPCVNNIYQANSISIEKSGLFIEGNNRYLCIKTLPFNILIQPFIKDDFKLKGVDAYVFTQYLEFMVFTVMSEQMAIAINRNPNLLNAIKEEKPWLLEYPAIEKSLVDAFKSGKLPAPLKRKRKPELTKDIFDLYHYVYFFMHQGLSLEKACFKTLEEQADLVPEAWLKQSSDPLDAFDALIQKVRRLNNQSVVSQKTTLNKDT